VPTIVTHALLPLIAAAAAPDLKLSKRLIVAAMIVAVLPDADLISRLFGVPHTHDFGHRGASHSILFALLIGASGAMIARRFSSTRGQAFWFLFLSCLSHPLADMLTDGGKGMMLFWPLLHERFAWPVRPVEVSSIGLRAIDNGSLDDILLSELRWLILPALLLAVLFRLLARPYIDSDKGQS
jgi:inner membrane protein